MDVRKMLETAGITPDKELDQHFLKYDRILDEEVKLAGIRDEDVVLEIGAGIGNLTSRLAKKAKVLAIEKDVRFVRIVRNIDNVNAVLGNALEVLESLRGKSHFTKVVSNIPYSVSQDIVIELLMHKWDIAVLMVQKEFAQKLIARNRLGLVVRDCADVRIAKHVPAEAFHPKAVPSSIIVLRQKKLLNADFWEFVKELKPNKNVAKVIKNYPLNLAKKKVHMLDADNLRELYEMNRSIKEPRNA